jgi:hypothetical protein
MSFGRNWFRYCRGVQQWASSWSCYTQQLTSPKRAGNCHKLAHRRFNVWEEAAVREDAYRLLLREIAGGAEDNNDSVVLELDAVTPLATLHEILDSAALSTPAEHSIAGR